MSDDDEYEGAHTCDNCLESTDNVVCDACQEDISDAGALGERNSIVRWLRSLPQDEWYPANVADAIEALRHAEPSSVSQEKKP